MWLNIANTNYDEKRGRCRDGKNKKVEKIHREKKIEQCAVLCKYKYSNKEEAWPRNEMGVKRKTQWKRKRRNVIGFLMLLFHAPHQTKEHNKTLTTNRNTSTSTNIAPAWPSLSPLLLWVEALKNPWDITSHILTINSKTSNGTPQQTETIRLVVVCKYRHQSEMHSGITNMNRE